MHFLRSFVNLSLGAIGGVLGNLLAAWVLQEAWNNLLTPARVLATGVGFVLVILLLAWLDARSPRPPAAAPTGIRGNVQIGRSLIRVLQGANVVNNLQIGNNTIEVVNRWSASPVQPRAPAGPPDRPAHKPEIEQRNLRQQQLELQTEYDDLTERLAAIAEDLGRSQDSEERLVLNRRRDVLVAQRQGVVADMQRIESRVYP